MAGRNTENLGPDRAAIASLAFGLLSLVSIPLIIAASDARHWPSRSAALIPPAIAALAITLGLHGRSKACNVRWHEIKMRDYGVQLGVLSLILCALLVFMLLPSLSSSRAGANRVECAGHLRQLGEAMSRFSESHDGKYPLTFDDLVTQSGVDPGLFVCPSSYDRAARGATTQAAAMDFALPGRCSYVYVGAGITTATHADTIVAHEKPENHRGERHYLLGKPIHGINVLFRDGHVEWLPEDVAETIIDELRAGKNPPPSLTSWPAR